MCARLRLVVLLLVAVSICGCGVDYKCEIESNQSWYGTFDGVSYTGTGNRTINLSGKPPHCVEVNLGYAPGWLTIQLKEEGGWFLNPTSDYDKVFIYSWLTYGDYTTDGPAIDCTAD